MQWILWTQCLLFVCSICDCSAEIQEGCVDWKLKANSHDVCCVRCHPGNRVVEECGADPAKLCKLCEPGTFKVNPMKNHCDRCTQCIGPRYQLKSCNATSDTVCGCKKGLRCGNELCSFCVIECGVGQEPTKKRDCRPCPEGTFNDLVHSSCRPWRTSCPTGEKLESKGNATSDIKCSRGPKDFIPNEYNTVEPLPTNKKPNEDDAFWPIVIFAGGMSVLALILILSLWVHQKAKTKTKMETKDVMPETLPPDELKVMMVEQDDACSFRQPEQEEGGSLDSLSSENSESKLIV